MLNILENVSLAPYTTFKIGGLAKYFIKTDSVNSLIEALNFAKSKNELFFILAGGSNILISDKGFNGVVIYIPFNGWSGEQGANNLQNLTYSINKPRISFDAGIFLSKAIALALQNGLSGFEWGVGIPGTIGGAVRGNSGAFGKGTGDFIEKVECLDAETMEIKKMNKEECEFYYRGSIFRKNKNLIILKADFLLTEDSKENIQGRMKEFLLDRAKKNSADLGKSAGCYFKNIPWDMVDKNYLCANFPEIEKQAEKPKLPTGFLIEQVGLKGKSIGGAEIPNAHANYIINRNNATSKDVLDLANLTREKIFEKYKIELEEEVELVGF